MHLTLWSGTSCLLATLIFLPLASRAETKTCPRGEVTQESYTWDFAGEAEDLLERVALHASAVRREADRLTAEGRTPRLGWEGQSYRLTAIRENVNDMGGALCRLEVIRRAILPWQQQAFDRILPVARDLAVRTETAINLFNADRRTLFATDYADHVSAIHAKSQQLSDSVTTFVEYARAKDQLERLEKQLEITGS